jgi:diguanylate cyclase (GGDEF)-like protein/PAS domain S-box-containing protein
MRSSAREEQRLARLAAYGIVGSAREAAFDDLVRRAQDAARVPMAWLAFHDGAREWVKAGVGISFAELSGEQLVAFRAGPPSATVEVGDACVAEWRTHPLVAGEPRVRFLCTVPLATADGLCVGALTVADRVARRLAPAERVALENIASLAMARLEARRSCALPARTRAVEVPAETAEEQLAREREFSDTVIQSLPGAFFLFSREGEMLRWNARLQEASGYANAEIASMRPHDFIAPEDHAAVDAAIRDILDFGREVTIEAGMVDKAGARRPFSFTGRGVRVAGAACVMGFGHDLSERKRAEHLATRDPLTGLPNRVLLHDRLEQGIVNAARHRTGFAFMFIDLDRFKTINDSLGHDVGDELLKGVAARLTACTRASDTVARLGGDEFAVILENLRDTDDEGAQQVAEKMIAAMAAPMLIGSQHLSTSCSIGISLYPADGKDSAALMKHADVAMYDAKEKGRNNYRFFSAEMNARAQERLSIENYLRLALRRNELVLHYQPRIRLADGALTGVEALVRWSHPRRGLLLPGKFIDVAEDSGLIVPIGEWVLERACRQAGLWQKALGTPLRVAVNLSVRQVADGERLLRAIEGSVRDGGIDPSTLELELTESILMQNLGEKAALLNRIGDLGVGISIDDFGTGYSSLAYLKTLPVDAIKVDSSFVHDLGSDPNDEAIVRAIVAMAHSLKLLVVAEGVETQGQLANLAALGCDEYQGYLESPALPPADFEHRYVG